MENVIIIAKVKIKEAYVSEVFKELVILHKQTHEYDKGCIQYDLHKNYDSNNSYTFVETWENQNFLDEHEKKEHFINCVQNIESKLESFEIQKLEKMGI